MAARFGQIAIAIVSAWAVSAHAVDSRLFPFLYGTKVFKSPALVKAHYEALKKRFSNGDFEEILNFPVNSRADGPRLSENHHTEMPAAVSHGQLQSGAGEPGRTVKNP